LPPLLLGGRLLLDGPCLCHVDVVLIIGTVIFNLVVIVLVVVIDLIVIDLIPFVLCNFAMGKWQGGRLATL
jgi:hypothetical protein